MIACWPEELITQVHSDLSLLWATKTVPSWWQQRWLCPIPKVPTPDPGMGDLRPLMLVEVLRKLWVGLIITKITDIWEDECILAPAQHGFRRLRGTDTALLQVINILEQAHESQSPAKLTELLWFMLHRKIDVLVLLDTRCGARASHHLAKIARVTQGIRSGAYSCGASPPHNSRRGQARRSLLVGGQMFRVTAGRDH